MKKNGQKRSQSEHDIELLQTASLGMVLLILMMILRVVAKINVALEDILMSSQVGFAFVLETVMVLY